jgi:hypothetical protein
MSKNSDKSIQVGRQHRTTRAIDLLVYDYQEMVIKTTGLPGQRFFRPWAPGEDWRGKKIPITLGEDDTGFDWGLNTGKSYFIRWNDFFSRCRLAEKRDLRDAVADVLGAVQIMITWRSYSARPEEVDSSALRQSGLLPARELFDTDSQGRTRLFYAAERGDEKEVERMMYRFPGTGFYPQRLGFIEKKDKDGLMAADVAEQKGQEEVAKLLRYEAWRLINYG